jgi:hypothetical protein
VADYEEEEHERNVRVAEPLYVDGELVAANVDLFRSRSMKWIQTRVGTWVLGLGNGFVRLSPGEGDRWDVHHYATGSQAALLRAGLPLGYAQGVAEDFARERGAGGLLKPDACWRSEPASIKQINWMRWKRIPVPSGLTKGQAWDIRQAFEGAKG